MEYLLNVVFQNPSTQPNQTEIGMSKQFAAQHTLINMFNEK